MAPGYLSKALRELGLAAVWTSDYNVKLLYIQRFVRRFAYGGSTLILVDYLSTIGVSEAQIGLFMTLTLIGDVGISLVLTTFADGLGRRAVLAVGAISMAFSGVVFAMSSNFWLLLFAAIFGVISPSGNEIGPFKAVEESTLAHLVPAQRRTDIYAWYSLAGEAGTALGLLLTGWSITYMTVQRGWDDIRTYRIIFYGYAICGFIKLILTILLNKVVEADKTPRSMPLRDSESAPFLGDDAKVVEVKESCMRSILPKISKESRVIVANLCILFGIDAFASGMASMSWIAYFFKEKFDVEGGELGSILSVTKFIAALSVLVASTIAKRFGNVKTMAFTHLPSSIFLAIIPFPSSLAFATFFLIIRSCTQSMDNAPRSAFLAAVVLPNERTAIMGIVNVVKTAAQSMAPLVTGILVERGKFWVMFVLAGSLKVAYDLGLLAMFAGHEKEEHWEERDERVQRDRSAVELRELAGSERSD
ncbi:major facilitator superfamily domain-containing protein [Amylocarpus encephaloides]|uniref:Major facilitator superfamily domain-containing protein n=1 Tax=Amylocarpus encephaloides TaxID=45428 RepID=A0A9P7YEW1_9HELO|nr:major facilitator superfamily domain-containing protein [Amylocarpus encephaloides]